MPEQEPQSSVPAEGRVEVENAEAENAAMDKVQDILAKGVAVHAYRWRDANPVPWDVGLEYNLENGINIGGYVYFNIVGRSINEKELRSEYGGYSIIFDISGSEEVVPLPEEAGIWTHKGLENGQFGLNNPSLRAKWHKHYTGLKPGDPRLVNEQQEVWLDEHGKPRSTSEFGYVQKSGIEVDKFRGIILKSPDKMDPKPPLNRDNLEGFVITRETRKAFDSMNFQADVYDALSLMRKTFGNNSDLFLPIYDCYGGLWWPRQMTHEQVKQFVAKRKEKKKAE